MSSFRVLIPGEPIAQPRSRSIPLMRGGKPVLNEKGRPVIIHHDPEKARIWKATAQTHMRAAANGRDPLTGPVGLIVFAIFTCPRSRWRKRTPLPRELHAKRPDADNVMKAVKDAGKGVLWLDDSQVCHEHIVKLTGRQGERPGVYVEVWDGLHAQSLGKEFDDRVLGMELERNYEEGAA